MRNNTKEIICNAYEIGEAEQQVGARHHRQARPRRKRFLGGGDSRLEILRTRRGDLVELAPERRLHDTNGRLAAWALLADD